MRKILLLPLTISMALAALLLPSCRRAPQWRTSEGAIWHTTYHITYDSPRALDDSILTVLNRVERSLSPFDPTSRISRINDNLSDTIDTLIAKVFSISQMVSKASAGRFDPTVSPLVNLWGFGYDAKARRKVEEEADTFLLPKELIDSALTLVGIADCSIHGNTIIKKHAATSFNFSAVTKGLGCDEVANMLRRNGCRNYMVEIGGEIAIAGQNPRGKKWNIQVDAPSSGTDGHSLLTVINPPDGGVATSGNYRNFHDTKNYGRIGHTIDPTTGLPASSDIVAATIIAPTCAEADAWATAAMAAGTSVITPALNNRGIQYLIVAVRNDSLATITSSGFPFAH